jgi:Patatin-like phospholipase
MDATGKKDKFSANNLLYDGASDVIDAERQHLQRWRGCDEPTVGLALSGGGIRSATYCLGVLQALAYKGALPNVDYLSTVSGGGYIGASLSYLLHQSASGALAETVEPGKRIEPATPSEHIDPVEVKAEPPLLDTSKANFPYVSYPMVGVGGRDNPVHTHDGRRDEKLKGRILSRLRLSSNYLVPGDGISFLSLAGVVVRTVVASVAVHVAVLVLLFQFLFWSEWFLPTTLFSSAPGASGSGFHTPDFNKLLVTAGYIMGVWAALSMLFIPMTGAFDRLDTKKPRAYRIRRFYEVFTHYSWFLALLLAVVGGLPWLHEALAKNHLLGFEGWSRLLGSADKAKPAATGILATVIGIAGNVWGFMQARSGKKSLIPTSVLLAVASFVLLIGVLLLVYLLTGWLYFSSPWKDHGGWILGACAAVLLVLGWIPHVNYVSLHRFYRDRLLELFMPDVKAMHEDIVHDKEYLPLHRYLLNRLTARQAAGDGPGLSSFKDRIKTAYARVGRSNPGDTTMLGDICGAASLRKQPSLAQSRENGPYHLINAHVVLTASQHPRYRPRGGDNFIFSPLYYGSRATGWRATEYAPDTGFTLATAMAISGAAVNPNAGPGGEGVTRQPVLSVLMGMLNLRLGYWVRNPRRLLAQKTMRWSKPNLIIPGLSESFGRLNLNEYERFLLLTDGGHFENLGLYELVRRRLKLIVVCDATADRDFKFTDLGNAIQKVRADFGAIIDITTEQLAALVPKPHKEGDKAAPEDATAASAYLIAPIYYSDRLADGAADPPTPKEKTEGGRHAKRERGTLILLKATAFKGMPADLFSYRRDHPEFPNQGTIDQFFDEKQFDAYREMGYITAFRMLKALEAYQSESVVAYEQSQGHDVTMEHKAARRLFARRAPS